MAVFLETAILPRRFRAIMHYAQGLATHCFGALSLKKYTAISVFLFSACSLRAQNFITGQAARAEFGQYTFTFGGATPGTAQTIPNQQILGGASGLAWANGTLFVADSNRVGAIPQDNRVIMFNTNQIPAPNADLTNARSYSSFQCNLCAFPAYLQVGQSGFGAARQGLPASQGDPNAFPIGTNNTATTSNMQTPTAVATDGTHLAVADTDNNRVLIWNSIPTTMNQPADLVLGQADFTHSVVSSPPTASSLRGPQGVWIQNGKLYVADTQDYRVLIWNSIPTSNNQPADLVLGQSSFNIGTQTACDPTKTNYVSAANELCNPVSVTSDGTHVFVADLGFNRVLIWNSIPNSNGQNADVVVGQPDMVSAVPNNPAVCLNGTGTQVQCAYNMNFPRYALSDGTRLFIADGGNDRVLIYNTIPTSNGARADEVLGQPNFSVDNVSSTAISIASTAVDSTSAVDVTPSPTSLAFDGLNLYVADPLDNRVLVFTPGNTPLPDSSVVNWASEIIRQEGIVTIRATTIVSGDTVTVTLGSNTYKYTVKSTDTGDTIAQGLVSLINAGSGDPNAIAIFAGTGTGALYLSSRGINLGYDTIAFSVAASNTTNITATASGNGYLTAGTAATAAPGMLVEINGTNLSDLPPGQPAVASLTGRIPTSLGGAQVFFDGVAGPVYSAASNQVVSQVPFNFNARNSTSVYVRTTHNDGSVTITNATPVYIAPANPGLFSAPTAAGQSRPWPASGAYHQLANPQAVVDFTGTVKSGDTLTIKVVSTSYTYTVQSSDTLTSITYNLCKMINNAPDPYVTAVQGGAFNRVVLVARQSGAAGNGIAVSTSTSSSADITLTAYTPATCCNVVNGSPITPTNPAAPGETITISGVGLGTVSDLTGNAFGGIPVGQPYTYAPINSATATVSATMGGSTSQVVSAGLPQGSYGVYQIQLIVPPGQAKNTATPLYVAQNAFISNTVTIPVGPPNPNPNVPPTGSSVITIDIDTPNDGSAALSGSTLVEGWAIDYIIPLASVNVSVDGVVLGPANYNVNRPDVCAAHPTSASCANGNTIVGYSYVLDTTQFADGPHTLQITAADSNGSRLTRAQTFTSSNYKGANATAISIDNPGGQGGNFQGTTNFYGWALNKTSGISSLTVAIDGITQGRAFYGTSRPDVCAIYTTSPNCQNGSANVGWSYQINTANLSNGNHVFSVSATAANGDRLIQAHSFTVANWTTANPTISSIDKPNSQTGPLSGVAHIAGWAVNPYARITSVAIAVDDIPLGNASYGGNRPDVCAIYTNSPGCPNVGWNFLLDTTLLADGSHILQVTYTPTSGQGYTQTTPFQVANQALGSSSTLISIDRPNASSAPVSGFAAFNGWASNSSSPVSTIEMLVDGILNGYAVYGSVRNDVCAKHPSPNCPNVGWNYMLDTLSLTNGAHLLQVTVTSQNGRRASAGSVFTVANSAGTSPTTASIAQPNAQNSPYQGMAFFSGTAQSSSARITSIAVTIDGYPYGSATYTPAGANTPIDWTFALNTAQLADGSHTLGVTATAADGSFYVTSSTFQIANWTTPSPTRISIDTPNTSSPIFKGVAAFGGWAINPTAPIASVTATIDSISFGAASYGGDRGDVCTKYPNSPGCPDVGWNLLVDTTFLANGTHTLAITATTTDGQSSTVSSGFTVGN